MEMEHSKGKWEVYTDDADVPGQLWISCDVDTIAKICHAEDRDGRIEPDDRDTANANHIVKCVNMHYDLVKTLTMLEDIISGIEAEADNKGINLSEARHWWVDARKLLDELEDQQSNTENNVG